MSYAALVAGKRSAPPPFLDRRFDAAGRPLRDSGNTVIAHVPTGPAHDALVATRDRLAATSGGACFAWLPPASYHMTIYDGLLHGRRTEGFWPPDLARDAAPEVADAFMIDRLSRLDPPQPEHFAMKPEAVEPAPGGAGFWVRLTPENAAEEARICGFRDDCAASVGLAGRPGHDAYTFHITLAYGVAWPDDAAARDLEASLVEADAALKEALDGIVLGPPEICCFQDMTYFEPKAVLFRKGTAPL